MTLVAVTVAVSSASTEIGSSETSMSSDSRALNNRLPFVAFIKGPPFRFNLSVFLARSGKLQKNRPRLRKQADDDLQIRRGLPKLRQNLS